MMVYVKHISGKHKEGIVFAHLLALLVNVDLEGRIFLLESVEGTRKVGRFLTLGLDRQRNDRVGNEHAGLFTIIMSMKGPYLENTQKHSPSSSWSYHQ